MFLVPVILLVGAAAAYSLNEADRYQATASVLLSDSASQRILDPRSRNPAFRTSSRWYQPAPCPAAFVGTIAFLSILDGLKAQADVVVLDALPLLAASDAHTLGKHVDAVILTARAGETTKGELAEVITVLAQTGANVIGIVLIGVEEAETRGRQYYYRSSEAPIATGKASKNKQSPWTDKLDAEEDVVDVTKPAAAGAASDPSAAELSLLSQARRHRQAVGLGFAG